MRVSAFILCLLAVSLIGAEELKYRYVPDWPTVPEGHDHLGYLHGEIRVDAERLIYVSTQSKDLPIAVFSSDGAFIKHIGDGVHGLHGFVIHADADGTEYIYGAQLKGGRIVKMTLEGEVVFEIGPDAFPIDKIKKKKGKPRPLVTSVDVAPNGDIYAVDGYGKDGIFVFGTDGKLKFDFGGKNDDESGLNQCHKIFIDRRFEPVRVLACDRKNMRIVHFSLEGDYIGEVVTDLRLPSSVDFRDGMMVVAEIAGRVVVINEANEIVATVSENNIEEEVNTKETAPDLWREGIVTSPHGICFDNDGNILVSEWNKWGRVLKFEKVD